METATQNKKVRLFFQGTTVDKVDAEKGIIQGCAVHCEGPYKDGRGVADATTLKMFYDLAVAKPVGVWNVETHNALLDGEDPLFDRSGIFGSFYLDPATKSLRASFQAMPSFMETIEYRKLMEMATIDPSSFGLSVVCDEAYEVIDGIPYLRPLALYSIDWTSMPNATNGVFSQQPAKVEETVTEPAKVEDTVVPTVTEGVKAEVPAVDYKAELDKALVEIDTLKKSAEELGRKLKEAHDEAAEALRVRLAELEEAKAQVATFSVQVKELSAFKEQHTKKTSNIGASAIKATAFMSTETTIRDQYEAIKAKNPIEAAKFFLDNVEKLKACY